MTVVNNILLWILVGLTWWAGDKLFDQVWYESKLQTTVIMSNTKRIWKLEQKLIHFKSAIAKEFNYETLDNTSRDNLRISIIPNDFELRCN